ncbi:hypothetical protein EMCRGX_G004058 [Ephydatia muelleri]
MTGAPDPKYFELSDTVVKFDPVKQWLMKNYKKYTQNDPPTNKSLAMLTCTMLQFQEDAFGKHVSNPALTKLPATLFEDYTLGGPLCQIMATAFRVKTEQRRFDFHTPARMDRGLELFISIHKDLVQNKVWEVPRVYIDHTLQSCGQQLVELVKRHQGSVVDKEMDATHIVYPPPPLPANPEEEYIRPLVVRGKNTIVHWCYHPDSYNSVVPTQELGSLLPEPAPSPSKPWRVSSRWLTDMDAFNEWMNEEDYEMVPDGNGLYKPTAPYLKLTRRKCVKATAAMEEQAETPDTGRRDRNRKRKRTPSPSPPDAANKKSRKSARKSRGKEDIEEDDLTKDLPNPPPVPKIDEIHDDMKDSSSLSKPGDLTVVGTSFDSDMVDDNSSMDVKEIRTSPTPSSTSHQSTLPSTTSTAQDKPVSSDQRERVPGEDIVVPQSQPVIIPSYAAWFNYNSIHAIEKRSLPEYFSGKNRSKTPEIYIAYRNFMVDSFRLNPTEYLTVTACRRNMAGDVGAIMRIHGFLEQWGVINYHVEPERRTHLMGPPSTAHFNVAVDTPIGMQPLPPQGKPSATDQLVQLSDKSLVSKEASGDNFGLRTDIYCKPGDESSRKPWTDQETLLLLEALELYRDDWNKVAGHVSTRTQDECILHFLKLPIEDPYLDEHTLGPLAYQPVPFSQQGNPVMSTVAFLASVVDPRVAAAAAKAALAEFNAMKDETAKPSVEESTDKSSGEEAVEGIKTEPPRGLEATLLMPPAAGNVATAAASALAAAAVKAKHLASVEERRIKSLVALLVETQMKKLEIKLKHFEELEAIMDRERESLELQRQQLLTERQQFQRDQLKLPPIRPPHRGEDKGKTTPLEGPEVMMEPMGAAAGGGLETPEGGGSIPKASPPGVDVLTSAVVDLPEDMGLPAELLGPLPDMPLPPDPTLAVSQEAKVEETMAAIGGGESSSEDEEVEVMGGESEECDPSFQDDVAVGTESGGDQEEAFNEHY